jgi:heme exporter protein C
MGANRQWSVGLWSLTAALFAALLCMIVAYTPIPPGGYVTQKIYYIHLPVAINTFLAAAVVFIASIGFLWQRRMLWDDLALAAGKVTVLLCSIVLLTGMIWGKPEWGTWWTFKSWRLNFSLVLWLLYVVYLMVRPAIESPHRRAVVSAVYGIAAFLDVPLVYLSAKLMEDIAHPPDETWSFSTEMKLTLLVGFMAVTVLTAALIASRFRLLQRARALEGQARDGALSDAAVLQSGEAI